MSVFTNWQKLWNVETLGNPSGNFEATLMICIEMLLRDQGGEESFGAHTCWNLHIDCDDWL